MMSENKKPEKKKPDDSKILGKLKECYELGKQYYSSDHRRMQMLNDTDNGFLWRAIGAKFPPYQILPDTNFISYVKDNILASLYTTAKSAEVRPTSEDDKELCAKLNIILDNLWSTQDIGFKQFQAGERAALLNLGVTQVGWLENTLVGKGDFTSKGQVVLQNIGPMCFMRDPFATDLETAGWCCTWNRLHKSVIMSNPNYSEKFKEFLEDNKGLGSDEVTPNYGSTPENASDKNHYNVFQFWIRTPEGKINEYHTLDQNCILHRKEDIKPSVFPFALLYCNSPGRNMVGISPAAKVFANNVAYNMMNSLALTAEYKNQRPPKFVSAQSGLNIPAFTRHGAEADRTFVVNQDASKAVHYQQFPQVSPQMNSLIQTMQMNIQDISGVDQRYTGRDTGSIITTGGTEEMLNRVTMIDTPKIVNYEKYTKDLTKIILAYMIEFSPKRKYFLKKPMSRDYEVVEIDFPNIDRKTLFSYDIQISSELPKNKQRVAAWADAIMEKQRQYAEGGNTVQLLTEEEWLMFQDIPFKELLLERMGFQRDTNAIKQASSTIMQYAALVEQGIPPEDALMLVSQQLQQMQAGKPVEAIDPSSMMPGPPEAMTGGPVPMPNAQQTMVPPLMDMGRGMDTI